MEDALGEDVVEAEDEQGHRHHGQQHDDVQQSDPDLLTARRNVEDARIANLAADAYLTGQTIAAEEGLDGYYWARTPYRGYFPNTIYGGGYGSYAGY